MTIEDRVESRVSREAANPQEQWQWRADIQTHRLSLRENIATSETWVRAMLALYERKEKEKEANEKEKRGREKDGVEANFYSSEAEYLF